MQETLLTWIDATIAVPPVESDFNTSEEVLVLYDWGSYEKAFYSHTTNKYYNFDNEELYNVKWWAKVHLPKSNDYLKLNLNPINLN